jgi:hypothetical protein
VDSGYPGKLLNKSVLNIDLLRQISNFSKMTFSRTALSFLINCQQDSTNAEHAVFLPALT